MTTEQDFAFNLAVQDSLSYLYYIIVILVFPLGFIFNVINIILFKCPHFKDSSMTFYHITFSINNNIMLFTNFFVYILASLKRDPTNWSNFTCIFFSTCSRVWSAASSWLIVLLTLDRINHFYNHRHFKFLKNKKIFVLFFMYVTFFCLNSGNLFLHLESTSILDTITNTTISFLKCTASKEVLFDKEMVVLVVKSILPFIVIAILSFTLKKLLNKNKRVADLNENLKMEYIFSYSMWVYDLFFLLANFPYSITLSLIINIRNDSSILVTSRLFVLSDFFHNVSLFLTLYNFTFMFLVNIKFNVLYRKEFMNLYYDIKSYVIF